MLTNNTTAVTTGTTTTKEPPMSILPTVRDFALALDEKGMAELLREWARHNPDLGVYERQGVTEALLDDSTAPEVSLNGAGEVINPRTGEVDRLMQAEAYPVDRPITVDGDVQGAAWRVGEDKVYDEGGMWVAYTVSDKKIVRLPEEWEGA